MNRYLTTSFPHVEVDSIPKSNSGVEEFWLFAVFCVEEWTVAKTEAAIQMVAISRSQISEKRWSKRKFNQSGNNKWNKTSKPGWGWCLGVGWRQWQYTSQQSQPAWRSWAQFSDKIHFLWIQWPWRFFSPPPKSRSRTQIEQQPQWGPQASRSKKICSIHAKEKLSCCSPQKAKGTPSPSYQSKGNPSVLAVQGRVDDGQDHESCEMNDWVVDHTSEGFCQDPKELVNVQNGPELKPIEVRRQVNEIQIPPSNLKGRAAANQPWDWNQDEAYIAE